MTQRTTLPSVLERELRDKTPLLWRNDNWSTVHSCRTGRLLSVRDVHEAERKLQDFAPLLMQLFPELESTGGLIESPLYSADKLKHAVMGAWGTAGRRGRWFIKGDHALPVAGSIKARGGIYEVLLHAEDLALKAGLIGPQESRLDLASCDARKLFSEYEVAVGSTGNLGLSIGIMAAALGLRATVHMSSDAKEWKKSRLRARGVRVVEHQGDFGAAIQAGRKEAKAGLNTYFVDDEQSERLFLGYSVAAVRLSRQLHAEGLPVDAQHPLFVYLPCGVGGAPGGITFGLRHLFGENVHCFFAEPIASPSMLVRLASNHGPICVADIGLDNRTEADGLAVGQASEFVAQLIGTLVSGVFTVPDEHLFEDLYHLEQSEGLRIEPSAAAGFRGPCWLLTSDQGRQYLANHCLLESMENATHILWTTGGAFVPDEEYRRYHERGRILLSNDYHSGPDGRKTVERATLLECTGEKACR